MDEPRVNTNSQDSSRPELGGSHHPPPYSILCAWPWGLHPNVILSWDSQLWSPEIPEIVTFTTLEAHNFLCKPLIEVRSKIKLYSSSKDFQWYVSRHLYLHASKSGRSPIFSGWELESQIGSLIFNPSLAITYVSSMQMGHASPF